MLFIILWLTLNARDQQLLNLREAQTRSEGGREDKIPRNRLDIPESTSSSSSVTPIHLPKWRRSFVSKAHSHSVSILPSFLPLLTVSQSVSQQVPPPQGPFRPSLLLKSLKRDSIERQIQFNFDKRREMERGRHQAPGRQAGGESIFN